MGYSSWSCGIEDVAFHYLEEVRETYMGAPPIIDRGIAL